tara:strand:+ start:1836 stop:4655 length:2820 start_codon:yes stop_codon:yes gene_type:complete
MDGQPNRLWILLVILGGAIGASWLVAYYTDWMWFVATDYNHVFWQFVKARFATGACFAVLSGVVVGVNLYFAGKFTRFALEVGGSPVEGELSIEGLLKRRRGYVIATAVLVFVMGNIGAGQWPLVWRYLHSQSFGVLDPIFSRDVGFYVFALPFYQFVVNFLIGAVIVSAIVVGLTYAMSGGVRLQESIQLMPRPLAHFSALGGVFLLLVAWSYRLKVYGLLFSQGRIFTGAGYVDVNVQIWAYWFLVILFIATSVLFFLNISKRESRYPLIGLGILVGGAVVVGSVPATVVQKLVVDPTELSRETPYIEHNISATRQAYGLHRVEERPFAAEESLTREEIDRNDLTIRNVRIWDERPMEQTYQQVQEIRPYYVFRDVDVDRYTIDGVYRQVMLSAREMDTRRLPQQARAWVNERLQYTHGYGVAVSPVNQVSPEGLPEFLVRDIPPVGLDDLEVTRPEIYYGGMTYGTVAVKTATQEFDYPSGSENKQTTYAGDGGVEIGGFFNRLAFAIRFMDPNLVLTSYMLPDSRLMYYRQIVERARKVAPFLHYDGDPYLVISEGRLFWMLDAYTSTNMYPYSTRTGGRNAINYIRNSVKVVVDAYHGDITFYQADSEDPLINAYASIFPGLLVPIDEMPADLRAHVRYPVDLFRVQAFMYRTYHMQDVNVFYNQEDLWEIPNEIYSDRAQRMEPYYIIVKLPGEEREEFLLMVPYTPAKKDNMIGWLAARCDGDDYGDLVVYQLPKDKLIFGPMQLEARIDQQPDISSQLTLWGQRGSQVIRGNLLAIPIESSFLYVEPIYLQARQESDEPQQLGPDGEPQARRPQQDQGFVNNESTAIPELKQVIVAYAGQVIMRDTFEEALNELFGRTLASADTAAGGNAAGADAVRRPAASARELATRAEQHYRAVQDAMRTWDWSRAGDEMQALEESIEALQRSLKLED